MEPIDPIIQQQAQMGNQPRELPILTTTGLLDLLDALDDDLAAQGGLVHLFASALRDELVEAERHA